MCIRILVIASLLGCGPSPVAGGDGGGSGSGSGDPTSCEPDQQFCRGADLRRCTASGEDSVFVGSCNDGAHLQTRTCVECAKGAFTCDADPPDLEGTIIFRTRNRTWRFPGGCAENTFAASAREDGGGFTLRLGIPPTNAQIIFHVKSFASFDGALYQGVDSVNATALVTVLDGAGCESAHPINLGQPPDAGHIHLELGDQKLGSPVSLTITGFLTCSFTQAAPWEPFTLTAHGSINAL